MKFQQKWFSLIEILVGMLIVSFVILAWFSTLSAVGIAKIKLIEKTKIETEAYFATERFFELIKKWGIIDYEEYWNRYAYNSVDYENGHFQEKTGFWNFWAWGTIWSPSYGGGFYYCASDNGLNMWTGWCLSDFNIPTADYLWNPQRYGQYQLQFIDHNSDSDISADENGDGNIVWDSDDLYLGIWPEAFPEWEGVWELYLINTLGNERTFFRWIVRDDENAPIWEVCNYSNPQVPIWWWCIGTIQFLKLIWVDYGADREVSISVWDPTENDGIVDTWLIHPDFSNDGSSPVAWSEIEDYWQSIFSDSTHVSKAEFYLYPNKNIEYSWRDTERNLKISPYLQIKLTLLPSWKEKSKIKWEFPSVDISTTIQLLDIDLQ